MFPGITNVPLFKRLKRIFKHITVGADMSEVAMFGGSEPRKILQTLIDKKISAIMSYLSKGKWHVAKVTLINLGANRLYVQLVPREKPQPINIQVNQPVGVSLKYEYGKFIFETKVIGLEPSPDATGGGMVLLEVPDRVEIVQRRNYFRVDVPKSLKVNVMLWHRSNSDQDSIAENQQPQTPQNERAATQSYWQGRLVDISAGGAQVVVDVEQAPDFKRGQFIGMRFTPMPYETPLMLNAQIRNILPTADGKSLCLGLQIVGLEASAEGRQTLQRLCNVVEQYYQINQSNAKQRDLQTTGFLGKLFF